MACITRGLESALKLKALPGGSAESGLGGFRCGSQRGSPPGNAKGPSSRGRSLSSSEWRRADPGSVGSCGDRVWNVGIGVAETEPQWGCPWSGCLGTGSVRWLDATGSGCGVSRWPSGAERCWPSQAGGRWNHDWSKSLQLLTFILRADPNGVAPRKALRRFWSVRQPTTPQSPKP